LLDGDEHHVVNSLFRKEIFPVIGENFEKQALDALGRRSARPGDGPCFLFQITKATLADRLDDRVLGRKEPVNIGGRHAELGRDIGNRGFREAQPAEQRVRGFHDPRPRVVGFDLCLRAHGRADLVMMSDD
jgi:hypothetical protein